MNYYSLPSDFKKETIDEYVKLNDRYSQSKINETYGQITEGIFTGSGRSFKLLPKIDLHQLEDYVSYSQLKGIKFNYTLNAACLGNTEFSEKGMMDLKIFLLSLNNINIKSFTLALPSLMEFVKIIIPDSEIKVSAISNIISPDNALFYKNLGVQRIVPNTDINRDFKQLESISQSFGQGVEIIVNSVCFKNCPYKIFHYNHESHSNNENQDVDNYYFQRCTMQKAGDLKNVIRLNWIRPEDISLYEEIGIRYFKIQGRNNVYTGDPCRTVEAYFKKDYNGNLYDLLTLFSPINSYHPNIDNKKLDGFVKRFKSDRNFCKNICSNCNYCDSFAQKSMDYELSKELNESTLELYYAIDDFKKLANKVKVKVKVKEEKKIIEATIIKKETKDFNF